MKYRKKAVLLVRQFGKEKALVEVQKLIEETEALPQRKKISKELKYLHSIKEWIKKY